MKFGAHVSIAGGIFNAPQNGLDAGCDVIQIFSKNQRQWRVIALKDDEVTKFKQEELRTGVQAVCVHASYLINLGASDAHKLEQSRQNFVVELRRAGVLGIPYVIVHPGSHLGAGPAVGMSRIAESLNRVIERCADVAVTVLLEATAGQGTNLGHRFEQLAEIKGQVEAQERIGFCLDTCHLFAAGYELRDAAGYAETIRQVDDILGASQIGVIHANDSKFGLGSKRDRHQHIGEGELGLQAFANFVQDIRFRDVPFIIETPGDAKRDRENLARLRALVEN